MAVPIKKLIVNTIGYVNLLGSDGLPGQTWRSAIVDNVDEWCDILSINAPWLEVPLIGPVWGMGGGDWRGGGIPAAEA
jgi:hypothetical protein